MIFAYGISPWRHIFQTAKVDVRLCVCVCVCEMSSAKHKKTLTLKFSQALRCIYNSKQLLFGLVSVIWYTDIPNNAHLHTNIYVK